jgi:hypothetical protein
VTQNVNQKQELKQSHIAVETMVLVTTVKAIDYININVKKVKTMKTKTEQIEELKATAAKLQQQIEVLEKPKEWEPRKGFYKSEYHTERDTVFADATARCAMNTQSRLLAYVDEFGGDWEADWSDNHQYNYCVQYFNQLKTWCVNYNYSTGCTSGTVYMSEDCAEKLVNKLNSGEVVL